MDQHAIISVLHTCVSHLELLHEHQKVKCSARRGRACDIHRGRWVCYCAVVEYAGTSNDRSLQWTTDSGTFEQYGVLLWQQTLVADGDVHRGVALLFDRWRQCVHNECMMEYLYSMRFLADAFDQHSKSPNLYGVGSPFVSLISNTPPTHIVFVSSYS